MFEIRRMRLADIVRDSVADELSTSEAMAPYIRAHLAMLNGDVGYLSEIKLLPLEKRYLWRVYTALKWGLADLDTRTARMDTETLPVGEVDAIREELQFRLMQLNALMDSLRKP